MVREQTALSASWLKEIEHLAGHAGLAADEIETAAGALKAARRALEDAADAADAAAKANAGEDVAVTLV
jgi:hypothetical protein